MELSLRYTFDGDAVIADSVNHPAIRMFGAFWNKSPTPLNTTNNRWPGASWRLSEPATLDCGQDCAWNYFAAVCYHYGLAIDNALLGTVPLGLLQVTYGGTWVEEWTRAEVVPQCGPVPHSNSTTGQIWNAMVSPLVNYTTHVTLWYQGETNTESEADATHYGCAFRSMITDLRAHQLGSNKQFYFVLLAPAHNATNGSLPLIEGWRSQLQALSLPHTGVANTIDLGDVSPLINELHPRNKSLIGQRLARLALADLYRQPTLVARGPQWTNVTAQAVSGQAGQVRITIQYEAGAENSLLHVMGTAQCDSCCDGVSSALFGVRVLADDDGAGSAAEGAVYWPSRVDIDVVQRRVQAVVALPDANVKRVRVDFENADSWPQCALYNDANLPALPFSVYLKVAGSGVQHVRVAAN